MKRLFLALALLLPPAASAQEGFPVLPGMRSKVVTTTYDLTTASGNQDITGCGFTPTSAVILGNIFGGKAATIGVVASDTVQSSIFTTSDTQVWLNNLAGANVSDAAGTNKQTAAVSFLSDGVRLTWTKTGSPTGTLQETIVCLR